MTSVDPPFDIELTVEFARLVLQAYELLDDFRARRPLTLPAPYQLELPILIDERILSGNQSQPPPARGTTLIGFIATADDTIYVAFRGTATFPEVFLDLDWSQVPYADGEGGLVHAGFMYIYDHIRKDIIDTVRQLDATGSYSKLSITGYSLGAALAVLAAPELGTQVSFSTPALSCFACPRVGNAAFVSLYESVVNTSWQVNNANDLAPQLPPSPTITPFITGARIFFYEAVPTQFTLSFGTPVDDLLDPALATNHDICIYYNTLCEQTTDPQTCLEQAASIGVCNRGLSP